MAFFCNVFECQFNTDNFAALSEHRVHTHGLPPYNRESGQASGGGDPCRCGEIHVQRCLVHPEAKWGAQDGGSPPESPKHSNAISSTAKPESK
jgi:hypothetical protein